MSDNDCGPNLAIRLTAPGVGAIAVVRLAGPEVRAFLQAHFSKPVQPNRCVHGELRDGDRVIDDPVVVLQEGAAAADINLHGGTWVVQACLGLAQRCGFEVIETRDAPLPDAALAARSTVESEALAWLPRATTELALRVLLAQPAAWSALKRRQDVSRGEIESILTDRALWWLINAPRVAIVGAANVGKSTLANQLFAQERSITADIPGTTRDWVGEIANIDGLAVMLIDTPGQRASDDAIERAAIARSREPIEAADLIVCVVDASAPEAPPKYANALVVFNKIDRGNFELPGSIRTVATTGQGVDDLRRAIRSRFDCESIDIDRPRVWTDRQRSLLQKALHRPEFLAEI